MKRKYTPQEVAELADNRRYQAFVTRVLAERVAKVTKHLDGDSDRFDAGEVQHKVFELEVALRRALWDLNNSVAGEYMASLRQVPSE